MRSASAILVIFGALIASGQPVIGPEVSSDAFPARNSIASTAPAVAMARDARGVAVAWTMSASDGTGRVHVSRLDATGRFSSTVHQIPLFSADVKNTEASAPSIAASPNGVGFVLAWLEAPSDIYPLPPPAAWRAVYSQLDADLNPSTPLLLAATVDSPVIVRSSTTTWLTTGGSLWQLQRDGSIGQMIRPGLAASDMSVNEGVPHIVASKNEESSDFTCSPEPGCTALSGPLRGFCYCKIHQQIYTLQFVALYRASGAVSFSFASDAAPAVASNGSDLLVAWYRGQETKGGQLAVAHIDPSSGKAISQSFAAAQTAGDFGPDSGLTRPDIAADGQRYVVVWRSVSSRGDHDILGASISKDGAITPFSIATSSADERDPSILAMGNGTFQVAYEKFSGSEHRVAGRLLSFGSRRHAAQ